MISISSESGIRLAKAKKLMDEHEAHIMNGRHDPDLESVIAQYESAADAVANELIADNFHEFTEQGDT